MTDKYQQIESMRNKIREMAEANRRRAVQIELAIKAIDDGGHQRARLILKEIWDR